MSGAMSKFSQVLRLSWPLATAQIAESAMLFTDTIMFGLLGLGELAGGGLGASIYMFIVIVATGLFSALGNEIAIASGEQASLRSKGDTAGLETINARMARLVRAGLWLAVGFATVIAIVLQVVPLALPHLGQASASIVHAEAYLRYAAGISFSLFAFLVLRGLAAGLGRTRSLMTIGICGCLLNVPVSYVLMVGTGNWFGGWNGMGVAGVALGTALVHIVMLVLLFRTLLFDSLARPVLLALSSVHAARADFAPYWRLGVPIALAFAMEAGLFVSSTVLAGTLGIIALAAHQIAYQGSTLAFNVYIGVAQGTGIWVGQSYGAGNIRSAFAYIRRGVTLGVIICSLAAVVLIATPGVLIDLFTLGFNTTDASAGSPASLQQAVDLRSLAVDILIIAALFQLVDCIQVVLMTASRALRLGLAPTLVAVFSYWGVGFPAAWLSMNAFGLVGLWLGLAFGLLTAAFGITLVLWQFRRSRQQKLEAG